MADSTQYQLYLETVQQALKSAADTFLPDSGSQVVKAARYSLFSGGKRVRGVLCVAVCDILGGNMKAAARYAAGVEMLHCYSLIHDDLPCMDNDDMRRGKPSCHKAYGEDIALLAGDALQTAAFETLAGAPGEGDANAKAVACLAQAAGARGMIYGQELDLFYENQSPTEEQLNLVHRNKTGMLINAAVQLGAIAASASVEDCEALASYAFGIGLVFQIVDDILDNIADEEELGKPTGSDRENGKTTFFTCLGAQKARKVAQDVNEQAIESLERFGSRGCFLKEFARQLLARHK